MMIRKKMCDAFQKACSLFTNLSSKLGQDQRMKVYLDTCIISGLAKEDINESERAALLQILKLHKNKVIETITSPVAKEEIDRIPENYRHRHLEEYNLLKGIPAVGYLRLDFFSVSGLGVKQTKEFGALFSLLKDRDDAKHIYQAYRSEVNYFITVDRRSILNKYDEIYSICKVKVYAPSEFIKNLSKIMA